jgi:hypothetical protein
MKITRSKLKQIIREELNIENSEQHTLNESIGSVVNMARSLWGNTAIVRQTRTAKKRAENSTGILDFIEATFEAGATKHAKAYAKNAGMTAMGAINAVEFAAISFALGIPMLTAWALNKGTSPEGQLRNLKEYAGVPLFFTGWRIDDNGERTEQGRLSDPFGVEYSQTYHTTEDHPIVEIIENQPLAFELYEDGVIGDEIMNWARGWWRDIANAKAEYLRVKREALELSAIGMDET